MTGVDPTENFFGKTDLRGKICAKIREWNGVKMRGNRRRSTNTITWKWKERVTFLNDIWRIGYLKVHTAYGRKCPISETRFIDLN